MGRVTEIAWTDATFNPWIGCQKISPGCDRCYAETLNKRVGGSNWGPGAPRRRTSEANWKQPLLWNRKAEKDGARRRVFCASMADVFDKAVPEQWRADLWALITATPHLDWLLLTKRPQNIAKMLPIMWGEGWPNVWLGTSVENQTEADRRIPHLLAAPAAVRFLSCEPLLGPVDLTLIDPLPNHPHADVLLSLNCLTGLVSGPDDAGPRIDWVIVGGESGPGARPMHPDWARALRDQCAAACVPFFFKQWGDWLDEQEATRNHMAPGAEMFGGDGMPVGPKWHFYNDEDIIGGGMIRVGKKAAGHLLDGVEHYNWPVSA